MKTFGRNFLHEFHVNPVTVDVLVVILSGMGIAIVLVAFAVMMAS